MWVSVLLSFHRVQVLWVGVARRQNHGQPGSLPAHSQACPILGKHLNPDRRTFLLTSPQESNKSQKDLQQEFHVEDAKLTCWVQRFSGGTAELSEGEAMWRGASEAETCTIYFQPAESISQQFLMTFSFQP